jgi:CHAD domain-containing protein
MAKSWIIAGLSPDQPLTEAASLIILSKFREALFYRDAVIAGEDTEAVHDMRVSLRRMWAAMKGFSNCFEQDPGFDRISRKARKLSRKLGAVRDLDVFLEMLRLKAKATAPNSNEMLALIDLIEHYTMKRNIQHKKLLRYFQKLEEQQFETEFIHFFTASRNSHSSAETPETSLVGL